MHGIIAPHLLNEDSFEYIISQIPTSLGSLNPDFHALNLPLIFHP